MAFVNFGNYTRTNRGNMTITSIGGVSNINGVEYRGNSVQVINGKIIVDGVEVTRLSNEERGRRIDVRVTGNVESISGDIDHIVVEKDVGSAKTSSGDIEIKGSVRGSVSSTSGDITIGGDVAGDAKSVSGSIDVSGMVGGDATTVSGDIKYKK